MRNPIFATALALVISVGANRLCAQSATGTVAPIQSTAHPFGLSAVAPVMAGGSDERSGTFSQRVLPSLSSTLNHSMNQKLHVNDAALRLDPNKLNITTLSDVRVYFVGESTTYHNTLGFNTGGGGVTTGNPKLIFPDASSSITSQDPLKLANRSAAEPLLPGDYSDIGTFAAGTRLDFFLIANGAQGGNKVYSTDQSVNPDGINHLVSFVYAVKDSPYLVIGFEDMYGGGDKDFNDLVFAVDIGQHNVSALVAMGTPEPAMLLTLGGFVAGVAWLRNRRELSRPLALA